MASNPAIHISSQSIEEQSNTEVTCRLCRRQTAKYNCPTCNVPYCSVACFRSQVHSQCSEGFYRKEIEEDIHSGSSKTLKERQEMLEMLKRFEEQASIQQSLPEDLEGDNVDEDDQADLAERLESIDLESASPDALWAMLTPSGRSKFMKAFNDPTSELAQQLLSSEQLEKEIQEPWWEAPNVDEGDGMDSSRGGKQHTIRRYGNRPTSMNIPQSMVKPFPLGKPLVFNMSAICITYAYITRHLGTSPLSNLTPDNPDFYEARRLVTQTVPFLTDRKSTAIYPNLSAVIIDIWSKFDLGVMGGDLFSLLLRDAALLLRPLRITPVASAPSKVSESAKLISSTHPHSMAILVLSDLRGLFLNTSQAVIPRDESITLPSNHVTHKLLYYAAHIVATPSVILDSLANEMMLRANGFSSQEEVNGLEAVKRVGSKGVGQRTGLVEV